MQMEINSCLQHLVLHCISPGEQFLEVSMRVGVYLLTLSVFQLVRVGLFGSSVATFSTF